MSMFQRCDRPDSMRTSGRPFRGQALLPVCWVPCATQVDFDHIYAEVSDLDADGLLGVSLRNVMPEQDVNPALGVGVAQTMRTG